MNPTITKFTAKHELSAAANLANFITMARDEINLWETNVGFEWSAIKWPVGKFSIRFTSHDHRSLHPSHDLLPQHLMHHNFMLFSKAYLRYRHTISPHVNILREMQALRAMEKALTVDVANADITKFEERHFNHAIDILSEFSGAQNIATTLINILETTAEFHITTSSCRYWKHPYVGKSSYDSKYGINAPSQIKDAKLPNQDAMLMVADIFSKGNTEMLDDSDTLVTSITCILLSCPMRISELLRLRINCLHPDLDIEGIEQHYLNYWVPKLKAFDRKPIPATISNNTAEAISRIEKISSEARLLALHYENSPHTFYRHARCPDVPDDQVLTRQQVCDALGFENPNSCSKFLARLTGSSSLKGQTLNRLWGVVYAEHLKKNPYFPYQEYFREKSFPPLRMSESLFCFQAHQFSNRTNTSPIFLASFDMSYYIQRMHSSPSGKKGISSPMCFFQKHGFPPHKLKSHSFRHWLNRAAKAGGLSIEAITEWSSRASCKQTSTYLNTSRETVAREAASRFEMHLEQQPQDPIFQDQADILAAGPIHRSRYGICKRSWRAGPCTRYADCLNCSLLLMCKGDKLALSSIKSDHANIESALTAAKLAIAEGERSASRWTRVAEQQLIRLGELIQLHESPEIPDGSPIEIIGTDFSLEESTVSSKLDASVITAEDHDHIQIDYGHDLLSCLQLL